MGFDLARLIKVVQRARGRRDQLWSTLRVEAPVKADDRIVLDQHVVRGGLRDAPRREADEHYPALESDAFGRPVVHVATDRVENHIGPTTTGDRLDLFYEILRLVVERVVGAEAPAELDLFVRPRGCYD